MKLLRIFSIPALLCVMFFSGTSAFSEPIKARSESDLRDQLGDEIREVLKDPYLKFSTEDLNGVVLIEATVKENGKIFFRGLNAENEDLRTNTFWKLNSMNLWTDPLFAKRLFRYKVHYEN